jgi:hypothetical protein
VDNSKNQKKRRGEKIKTVGRKKGDFCGLKK